jgi:hypothetical protein
MSQALMRSAVRIIEIPGFEEHAYQYYPLKKFRQGLSNTLGIESKISQGRPVLSNQLFPENKLILNPSFGKGAALRLH